MVITFEVLPDLENQLHQQKMHVVLLGANMIWWISISQVNRICGNDVFFVIYTGRAWGFSGSKSLITKDSWNA